MRGKKAKTTLFLVGSLCCALLGIALLGGWFWLNLRRTALELPSHNAASPSVQSSIQLKSGWALLTPEQQKILAPLKGEWDKLSQDQRKRWIEISKNFSKLTLIKQQRLQKRMTEWANMTPKQRLLVRESFEKAKGLSAQAKQKAWQKYQQLTQEQKNQLIHQAQAAQQVTKPITKPVAPIVPSSASHSNPPVKESLAPDISDKKDIYYGQ